MLYSRTVTSIFLASVLCGISAYGFAQRDSSSMRFDPISDAELVEPSDQDWLIWRRTYDAQGYSPLDQINKNNVGKLEEAWRVSLLEGPNMATPLVHDGVMFLASAQDTALALDATTGKQ